MGVFLFSCFFHLIFDIFLEADPSDKKPAQVEVGAFRVGVMHLGQSLCLAGAVMKKLVARLSRKKPTSWKDFNGQ